MVSPFARWALACDRSADMGVSDGMSEDKIALTSELDDKSVAANASTERLTIIVKMSCRGLDIVASKV